jgi:transcriptional regulator with XRE-family HTH domain
MVSFATELRALMTACGVSGNELARQVPCDPALISRYANGRQQPSAAMAARLDGILGADGRLAAVPGRQPARKAGTVPSDETGAIELARRCTASDAGETAVTLLEQAADDLAVAYASARPADLLARTYGHLEYAAGMLSGRMTLSEHRRLLITTGWLSLIAATSLTDLRRHPAALAYLRTAAQIAKEAGHAEIASWALETRAWQALITNDYTLAARLATEAQDIAPRGSSPHIQATAQEGRALARLGDKAGTYDALARTEALVSRMIPPDNPRHHYQYDGTKQETYVATTLAWIGDPAAVPMARQVLARVEGAADGVPRPRRAALAMLDLALALARTGQPDEAAAEALGAVTSGLVVPSSWWRAAEVISVIPATVPGRAELADAYRELTRSGPRELT